MYLKPWKTMILHRVFVMALPVLLLSAQADATGGKAHQHGVGQLNIAVQGDHLSIELEAPANDIVGFEYAPRTAAEKQATRDATAKLRDSAALFVFPPAAECRLKEAEIEAPHAGGHDGHDKHQDEKHGKHDDREKHAKAHDHEKKGGTESETHSEFHAQYHFVCAKATRLSHIDLGYFGAFPRAQALTARTIGFSGQRRQRLTPQAARLKF